MRFRYTCLGGLIAALCAMVWGCEGNPKSSIGGDAAFSPADASARTPAELRPNEPSDDPTAPGGVGFFQTPSGSQPRYPLRIAVAPDSTVFVSDVKANRVLGLQQGEVTVELVGLDRPLGVAVHQDLLFVGNHGRGSVEVYDLAEQTYVRSLGNGQGEFSMPNAIAVASDGTVYVVDSKKDVVRVYGADGALLRSIGEPGEGQGQFRFPVGVAVDDERVVVGDQGNFRVQVFDRQGSWQLSFGEAIPQSVSSWNEYAGRFTRVQGVALSEDEILVLDSFHSHIQVFDRGGVSRGFLGRRGHCESCLSLAQDLELSAEGRLLVTDPERGRFVSLPNELGWAL